MLPPAWSLPLRHPPMLGCGPSQVQIHSFLGLGATRSERPRLRAPPSRHVSSTALALLPAGASEPSRGAPPSPPRQGRMPPPRTPAPQPLRPWNRFPETVTPGGVSPCPERPAGLRRRRPRSPAVKGRASLGAGGTRTAARGCGRPALPPAQRTTPRPASIGAPRPGGLGTSRVLCASVSPARARPAPPAAGGGRAETAGIP